MKETEYYFEMTVPGRVKARSVKEAQEKVRSLLRPRDGVKVESTEVTVRMGENRKENGEITGLMTAQ